MKVITVQQPWAWAIICGGKDVENRTQVWKYRGPLAIHAGTRWSTRGMEDPRIRAELRRQSLLDDEELRAVFGLQPKSPFHVGAVLGIVDLIDVHRCEPGCCESQWAEHSYVEHGGRHRGEVTHLVHEHVRRFTNPIPARGALGLWTPDPDLAAELEDPSNVAAHA